jgi:hypothetical protein
MNKPPAAGTTLPREYLFHKPQQGRQPILPLHIFAPVNLAETAILSAMPSWH